MIEKNSKNFAVQKKKLKSLLLSMETIVDVRPLSPPNHTHRHPTTAHTRHPTTPTYRKVTLNNDKKGVKMTR